jgi:hypothetical protein
MVTGNASTTAAARDVDVVAASGDDDMVNGVEDV